jgi:acyl-CoA thioester hydrolase
MMHEHTPPLGFPRVHAECDYKSPLRFEEEFEVRLLVREKKPRSLSYRFEFRRPGPRHPVEVARGALTVVCVTRQPDGTFAATPIPRALADQLEVAPADWLA